MRILTEGILHPANLGKISAGNKQSRLGSPAADRGDILVLLNVDDVIKGTQA
jgi:hypothetical protein